VRGDPVAHRFWPLYLRPMKADRYYLREHAFFCVTSRHCIFLHLKRDKYLCIGREQFELLRPRLEAIGDRTASSPQSSPPSEQASQLAADLMKADLISDVPCGTTPGTFESKNGVLRSVHDIELSGKPPRHPLFLPQFLRAAWTADRRLSRRPISEIVGDFRTRKRLRSAPIEPTTIEQMHRRITTFNALRLIYPRQYLCLFDSLALAEFLAQVKLYPDWAFGVSADPFRAHCWLQICSVVLNDTVEHVSTYTPIMTV
jgi:hypothetical protein